MNAVPGAAAHERPIRFYLARRDLAGNSWLSNLAPCRLQVLTNWRERMARSLKESGVEETCRAIRADGDVPLVRSEREFLVTPFSSVEHAYQWMKPKQGKDWDLIAEWIRLAPFPRLAAHGAHSMSVYDVRPEWDGIKVDWMRLCLRMKFDPATNRELVDRLLATGDAPLIEASTGTDKSSRFWGEGGICKCGAKWKEHTEQVHGGQPGIASGLAMVCEGFEGNGQNMLGKLLEEVRGQFARGLALTSAIANPVG